MSFTLEDLDEHAAAFKDRSIANEIIAKLVLNEELKEILENAVAELLKTIHPTVKRTTVLNDILTAALSHVVYDVVLDSVQ